MRILRLALAVPLLAFLELVGYPASGEKLRIIDKPIRFGSERTALTRQYIARHYALQVDEITIVPRAIVVHWTGIRTLDAAWRAFDRVRARRTRPALRRAGQVNVSAHFLIDRDGTVYRLMPETWMARHCIGLNYDAIGIENVGGGTAGRLTERQLQANAELIRQLQARHPVRYLLGHFEWPRFSEAPFFRERDPRYRHHKADPGRRFMRRLRALLRDLGLKDRYRAPSSRDYRWARRARSYEPLSARIRPPPGYRRTSVEAASFAHWLRHLPLLPAATPVRAFDGSQILAAHHPALAAVVDLDVGKRNWQQCADTIMRLRAEYLASRDATESARFFWTRQRFSYRQWARGLRPVKQGKRWRFVQRARPSSGYASFRRYLDHMFIWTGTWQLASEPRVASTAQIEAGHFFVQAGSPGHTVIVLDVARNDEGQLKVLVGQGFMPAQDLHLLRNAEGSPWFSVDGRTRRFATPFWRPFTRDQLHRFSDR